MNPKLYIMAATLWVGGINNLTASALIKAVRKGNPEEVEQLAKEVNIEATDKSDNTALHIAALYGYAKVIGVLLGKGAKIEATNSNKETALHLAAGEGKEEAIEVLLKAKPKANIEAQTKRGNTPLHIAALYGYAKVIEVLLGKGAKIEATNSNKETALHLAAWINHVGALKELLKAKPKANIEAKNDDGNTSLHIAARECHAEVVKELLMRGADVEVQNGEGETALTIGDGRMAAFIKEVLKNLEEEEKSQEIDTAETKAKEKERAVAQQVAVGGIRQIVPTKKNEPDNDEKNPEGVGQQVGVGAINSEEQSSPNFFSRLIGRGVAVGVVLCVLLVLILLYVRVHYWRPQPTPKPF